MIAHGESSFAGKKKKQKNWRIFDSAVWGGKNREETQHRLTELLKQYHKSLISARSSYWAQFNNTKQKKLGFYY